MRNVLLSSSELSCNMLSTVKGVKERKKEGSEALKNICDMHYPRS